MPLFQWVSGNESPDAVELVWDKPRKIGAVRIVTGQGGGPEGPRTPIVNFVLQYHDGADYRDIEATKTEENHAVDWHARVPPVTTNRLRLLVTRTPGNLTRIWGVGGVRAGCGIVGETAHYRPKFPQKTELNSLQGVGLRRSSMARF